VTKVDDVVRLFIGHDCPNKQLRLRWHWLKDTWNSVDDNAQISQGYEFKNDLGSSKGIRLRCRNRGSRQRCDARIPKGNGTKLGIELQQSDISNVDGLIASVSWSSPRF